MEIGVPSTGSSKKALLLGSGELGKEVAIELMRFGVEVIACDRYAGAPAMQVAHRAHVFDMLDPIQLKAVIHQEKPDYVVPEVEAIATDALLDLEEEGFNVVPTAKAAKLTMDREGIRRLAAEELGLPTAPYAFAETLTELGNAAENIGYPVVIKPIMSSSGKGQSVAKSEADLASCWEEAQSGGRAGKGKVIVEGFVDFASEITLLTVRASNGTHYCDPVGHRQQGGDYVESWQPHSMTEQQIATAREMSEAITSALGGYGVFGVELFLLKNGQVLFSEVSPRPHDTGLVTLATQDWSEFALHARAILGLPIQEIKRHSIGASAAVKSKIESDSPVIQGVEGVFSEPGIYLKIFGKPNATIGRRMAVVLARGDSTKEAVEKAVHGRKELTIE